jgi:hypothetical protein
MLPLSPEAGPRQPLHQRRVRRGILRHPHAYLDPEVRAGISTPAMADAGALRPGLDRLAHDLESRRWPAEHADLLDLDEFGVGYITITAEW